jgi:hypothetical protein
MLLETKSVKPKVKWLKLVMHMYQHKIGVLMGKMFFIMMSIFAELELIY